MKWRARLASRRKLRGSWIIASGSRCRIGTIEKYGAEFEADETFIGGLARNMHKDQEGQNHGHGRGRKSNRDGSVGSHRPKVRLVSP